MGHIIGVDFGTTNSIISIFKKGVHREFDVNSTTYVKSAIAFDKEKNETYIGSNAVAYKNTHHLYRYFKMFLNIDRGDKYQEKLKQAGWDQAKAPYEVAASYLKELISNKESGLSFLGHEGGKIDKIALTIPASWESNINNTGFASLKNILTKDLGFPNEKVRLISEPQAASAYFLWRQREEGKSFKGNLLICDMGGGTFDISLVKIDDKENEIKVLYNGGSGKTSIGEAGVNYDRVVAQALFNQITGEDDFSTITKNEVNEFIEAYEKVKIRDFTKKTASTKEFEKKIKKGEGVSDETLFSFGLKKLLNIDDECKVSGRLLVELFNQHIRGSIIDELSEVQEGASKNNLIIDKILIVGGFGRFCMVQKTILDFFKIGFDDPKFVQFDGNRDNYYAIARGAALVAANEILIGEKVPYHIGVKLAKFGKIEESKDFNLIKKGQIISDNPKPSYLNPEIKILEKKEKLSLDFFISLDGKDKHYFNRTFPADLIGLPKGADCKMGMYIDKSKVVYVLFKDKKTGKEYKATFNDMIGPVDKIYFS